MDKLVSPYQEPEWNSKPAWKMPSWVEPLVIITILLTAMFMTRRRQYRILGGKPGPYRSALETGIQENIYDDEFIKFEETNYDDRQPLFAQKRHLYKTRHCCGSWRIYTPNSSRFKNHIHSRILQKLPFLVEMFYWGVTYGAYQLSQRTSARLFKGEGIWKVAEAHAIHILEFEHFSWLRYFLPGSEQDLQQLFMHGHQDALTFLNRFYSLVHIPGTVGFIAWYYYVAPSHPTFATIRRTLTLTNYIAFIVFIFYPVMPPRLLPQDFGFLDTVHHDDAQSVWMSGRYVNQLAAMPSMHFGYSFVIGCTFVYHSGVLRTKLERGEGRKNALWKVFYCILGVTYPTLILVTIVASANHYWLDAIAGFFCVIVAFLLNRLFLCFLPVEDWLLWVLRLEKPIPSTGESFHARGGEL